MLPLGISPSQIRSYPLHGLRGKAVIVIAQVSAILMIPGCAEFTALLPPSMPTQEGYAEWAKQVPLGKDKAEADKHFAQRNNDTGRWKSSLISSELTNEGNRSVYRYGWKRNASYSDANVFYYDLTFIADRLIKFEWVNPEHSSQPLRGSLGMGFLCKDAIARGDEGGIRVHCQ